MLQFYQKQSLMSWFQTPLVLGIIALLCIFLAISVYERYTIEREMAARRAVSEAEVAALEERKAALEERVEYLSNERGIEAEMRRNFDVARPGEEVVIILDAESTTVEPLDPLPPPPKPWYQFW